MTSANTVRGLCSPGITRLFLAATVVLCHASSLALGRWAVNVFFLLSGYWTSRMFQSKYTHSHRRILAFYVSRFLRLWPVYCVCMTLLLTYLFFHPEAGPPPHTLTVTWYLRNLLIVSSASQYQPLGPAWSLDVEMQFYLLLPLLLLIPLAAQKRGMLLLVVGAFLFPLTLMDGRPGSEWLPIHFAFFAFGMAEADLRWKPTVRLGLLAVACFALACLAIIAPPAWRSLLIGGSHPANRTLFACNPALCSVLALLVAPYVCFSVSFKSSPLDRSLGNLAYPIYLFHWIPQLVIATHYAAMPFRIRLLYTLLDLAVVAIGSLLISLCIDVPCERFRGHLIERVFSPIRPRSEHERLEHERLEHERLEHERLEQVQ